MLSAESVTWVPRQQLKTTCFSRDTGEKRALLAQQDHKTSAQSKKRKDDRKAMARNTRSVWVSRFGLAVRR